MTEHALSIPVQLGGWLCAQQPLPFDWRSHNCCHLVSAWVAHAVGRDPMQGLPTTPTMRSALRLVSSLYGMRNAVSQCLGCADVPAGQADPGDVVMFCPPKKRRGAGVGAVLAVCLGADAVCLGERGELLLLPMADARCAWRLSEVRR